ncbi:MAG: BrnT family toxin [Alphaproteobacteria bacterium]|jgi:uncharacterized DUF497 family protein|nr:BrnT family toxin [Alphaproteobacteria bacterium]
MDYEWDEAKRLRTIAERKLDFSDAKRVLAGLTVVRDVPRHGEDRKAAVGKLDAEHVTVIHVDRGARRRVISIRRARK